MSLNRKHGRTVNESESRSEITLTGKNKARDKLKNDYFLISLQKT